MSLGSSKQQWIQGNAAVSSNNWIQCTSTLANARTWLSGIDTSDNVNTFLLINANAATLAVGNVTYNGLSTGGFRVLDPTVRMNAQQIVSDFAGNTWMAGVQAGNIAQGGVGNIWVGKYNTGVTSSYWQTLSKVTNQGQPFYNPVIAPKFAGNGAVVAFTNSIPNPDGIGLISYNNSGTVEWSQTPNFYDSVDVTDTTIDSTGNIWLSLRNGNVNSGLLKLTSAGSFVYGNSVTQTVGGTTKSSIVWNLATNSVGNAYVAVYSTGWPGATDRLTTVAQMNQNGTTAWATNLWNVGPSKISGDKSGNIYVGTYNATSTISYLVKMNGSTGSVIWAKQFTATDNFANVATNMTLSPVYATSSGTVVAVCQVNGSAQTVLAALDPSGINPPTNVAFAGNGVVVSVSNVTMTSNTGTLTFTSNVFSGVTGAITGLTNTSPTYAFSGTVPNYINNAYFPVIPAPAGPLTITYLAIGGGGGGGAGDTSGAGGGGAGGFVANSFTATASTVYTITVGQGGAGKSSATAGTSGPGNNGSNTSITGTGLTTITAFYGGGGGGNDETPGGNPGLTGASGGGAGNYNMAGTPGQTFNANAQGNWGGDAIGGGPSLNYPSAGGGGAGARGAKPPNLSNGGAGGVGLYSTITGANVAYAGGGGGATYGGGTGGAGGAGGGGTGGTGNGVSNATSGANGKGGGGGGQNNNAGFSGAGGNGVVILSITTSSYSGTYTGSNVAVTTSGSNTILTFNANGTYTA
jgi:hypothetical protein